MDVESFECGDSIENDPFHPDRSHPVQRDSRKRWLKRGWPDPHLIASVFGRGWLRDADNEQGTLGNCASVGDSVWKQKP